MKVIFQTEVIEVIDLRRLNWSWKIKEEDIQHIANIIGPLELQN